MNGTSQAILFCLGIAFVGFGLLELGVLISSAFVGIIFPLAIGGVMIGGAVKGRKNRKRIKATFNDVISR